MAKSESSVPVSASDADGSSHSKPWQSYDTVYTNAKAGKSSKLGLHFCLGSLKFGAMGWILYSIFITEILKNLDWG